MDSKTQQNDVLTAEQMLMEAEIAPISSMSMGEKLHNLFKRSDLVRIKNIDDKPSGYIFVNPDDEVAEQPNPATRRITPGKPQAVVLQPGEVKVIPGWQAYIALDRMWKEYAQRRSSAERNMISDDAARDVFLDKSFLGIFDPNEVNEARPVTATAAMAADKSRTAQGGDYDEKQSEAVTPDTAGEVVAGGDDLGFAN